MLRRTVILTLLQLGAAVLLASPLAGGEDSSLPEWILHFQLTETPDSVLRTMGGASIVHLGRLDLYEFRRADQDSEEEPDWRFTFQLPKKQLVVVTRNYENAIDVSKLFPQSESELKFYPNEEKPALSLLVRKLDSRRLLLARLTGGSRNMADQLVLASPAQAVLMFPVLAEQSAGPRTP
jgi:hypothetical protein